MQVHIDRNGERYGPYSIEEINAYLANGTLLPTDLAWQYGMTDWLPVSQISGVVMPGDPVATPIPPSQPVPNGNKKKILIGIGAGMGLLALMAGIWFFFIREAGDKEQLSENKENNSTAAKPVKELTTGKVAGSYEFKNGEDTFKYILLENGDAENFKNNEERPLSLTWEKNDDEVHVKAPNGVIAVFRIEPDGGLTRIGKIMDGERKAQPEDQQRTWKKTK